MAFRGDSTDTYTYASGSTGGTVDLGARNNYRYINAQNVYNKGKADGYTTHTGTYTFPANDTGGTKDLGTIHSYRYVNATNVYNKGKTDGGKVLLYTNSATSHPYTGFEISVNMSAYSGAIITWKNQYGIQFGDSYCPKNVETRCSITYINSGSSNGLGCYRPVTITDSKVTFGGHFATNGTYLTSLTAYNLLDKIYGVN